MEDMTVKDIETSNQHLIIARTLIGKGYDYFALIDRFRDLDIPYEETICKLIELKQISKNGRDLRLINRQKIGVYSAPGVPSRLIKRTFKGKELSTVFQEMFLTVCEYYEVDSIKAKSKSRKREYVIPRQMFCYIAMRYVDLATLKNVGLFLGGRDHSTVIHARQTVQDLLDTYDQWSITYKKILQMLNINY